MQFDYFLWTLDSFEIQDLTCIYQQLSADNNIRFWFKLGEVPLQANTLTCDALFVFEKNNEPVLIGRAKVEDILKVAAPAEIVGSLEAEIRAFFTLPTTLQTQQDLGTLGYDIESIISNLFNHATKAPQRRITAYAETTENEPENTRTQRPESAQSTEVHN